MADNFQEYTPGLSSPATDAVAVTPNDSTDLTVVPRALWVGGAGDLSVIMRDGSSPVTFTGITVGYHPLRVSRVRATGTTATNIVALT